MKLKMMVILSVGILSTVASGFTNVVANECGGISGNTAEQTRIGKEEISLARLRRLDFNAFKEDEETVRLSISGGDVPVYVNAKAQRDVSGDVYYMAFKVYGKWYFPKNNESSKLLHARDSQEKGWQLLPIGNGQCVVMYFQKIRKDVSDSKLVDAILSVQRIKLAQFPLKIDSKYQKIWASYLLGVTIYNQECEDEKISKNEGNIDGYCKHSPFNQDNRNKTMALINDYDMCPEDFKQTVIDYVDAQARMVRWMQNLSNREPDSSIDDAASVGATLGSLNQDNPQGGAILGALLGGIIGAAYQEDQRKELYAERDRLTLDVKEKRKKFGDYLVKIIGDMRADQNLNTPPVFDASDR